MLVEGNATRCCNMATFLCAGAKSEQWLTLGVECVTKHCFEAADATKRAHGEAINLKSPSLNKRHNVQPLKLRSWSDVGFMESAVLIFSS